MTSRKQYYTSWGFATAFICQAHRLRVTDFTM